MINIKKIINIIIKITNIIKNIIIAINIIKNVFYMKCNTGLKWVKK